MLYNDRIYFSEGIDVNKPIESKECDICHHWYFLDKELKFRPYICYGCRDVLIMLMNISDIAIWIIKSADYDCVISGITKSETINVMQNIDLTKKSGTFKT